MRNLLFTLLFSVTIVSGYSNSIDTSKSQQQIPVKHETIASAIINNKPPCYPWCGKNVTGADWVLVCAPIALFILSILVINGRTKEFKLQDALTENQYPKITQQNPMYTNENLDKVQASPALVQLLTPTIDVSDISKGFPKSSSRYLALISSTLTLIIAACLSSTFIYLYISSGKQPEFNNLGDILLALGIGITPYAVNKISAAVSSKN
jgi:hypothetical protein